MNWSAMLLAAKRSDAAYLIPPAQSKAAFEVLGDTFIGQFQNASHQAVLSADAQGETHLSISGTRASALKLLDIFADVSLEPVSVTGGAVTAGVYEGMAQMWDWVHATVPAGDTVHVAGHSLGASRTHLTPLFLPAAQIGALHSFEAPKFANAAFYAAHAVTLADMVCVLNAADLWAAWPWRDDRWQARPQPLHVWLQSAPNAFAMIPGAQWPGGTDPADHDIGLVITRIAAIAASQEIPA